MLEELQAVGMVGLVFAHAFLIRGCFGIKEIIPVQGGAITNKIDKTAELLDEMAQLIADFADGIQSQASPPTQPMGGIGDLLSTWLMRQQQPAEEYATKEQEWEVFPPNDDTTTQEQTKNEHSQPRS